MWHFCHRFQLGRSLCACFIHVPEVECGISATDFSEEHPLVLVLFMSQRWNVAFQPQISVKSILLCLFYSCPRGGMWHFCHGFQRRTSPCACLFDVAPLIRCQLASAYRIKKELPENHPVRQFFFVYGLSSSSGMRLASCLDSSYIASATA